MIKNFSVAKLNLKISYPEDMSYFEHRMAEYRRESDAFSEDIFIECERCTNCPYPSGEFYKSKLLLYYDSGRECGFFTKSSEGRILNLVSADKDWTRVRVFLAASESRYPDGDGRRLFNILNHVMEIAVLTRGRLVLHASAINYKGSALAFSAPSGTGKSTHTGLWRTVFGDCVSIVNDDRPIIILDEESLLLCGSPWSGTSGINTNQIIPLAAIVCLERGNENYIERLKENAAVLKIIKETPKPVIPYLMPIYMDRVNDLIKRAKMYRLYCTISPESVHTVESEIFIVK
ncbi:MAG: hypothetical protein N2171_01360 [Clostridia bacterium]|nr:hypothetical protein [Clostridia bacterium]